MSVRALTTGLNLLFKVVEKSEQPPAKVVKVGLKKAVNCDWLNVFTESSGEIKKKQLLAN